MQPREALKHTFVSLSLSLLRNDPCCSSTNQITSIQRLQNAPTFKVPSRGAPAAERELLSEVFRPELLKEPLRPSSRISSSRVRWRSSDFRMDLSGMPQLPTSTGCQHTEMGRMSRCYWRYRCWILISCSVFYTFSSMVKIVSMAKLIQKNYERG